VQDCRAPSPQAEGGIMSDANVKRYLSWLRQGKKLEDVAFDLPGRMIEGAMRIKERNVWLLCEVGDARIAQLQASLDRARRMIARLQGERARAGQSEKPVAGRPLVMKLIERAAIAAGQADLLLEAASAISARDKVFGRVFETGTMKLRDRARCLGSAIGNLGGKSS
jgi:hypothetical protein